MKPIQINKLTFKKKIIRGIPTAFFLTNKKSYFGVFQMKIYKNASVIFWMFVCSYVYVGILESPVLRIFMLENLLIMFLIIFISIKIGTIITDTLHEYGRITAGILS